MSTDLASRTAALRADSNFGAWRRHRSEEPNVLRDAARLWQVALAEETSARRATSATAQSWQRLRGVLADVQSGTADGPAFRAALRELPHDASRRLHELSAIFQEASGPLLGESCLILAQRWLERELGGTLARELLSFSENYGASPERVRALRLAISGGGGLALQFEFQAPHLLRELLNPITLGSFGVAGLAARATSFGVLLGAGRATRGAVFFSEAAALGVEVPALVLSRRIGEHLFHGGAGLLDPDAMFREMKTLWLPFAALRVSSNALRFSQARVNAVVNETARGETLARAAFSGGAFATEVLSLAAGHSANRYLGLESANPHGSIWVQSLLTAMHQRVAGHMIERSGMFRLPAHLEMLRRHREASERPRWEWLFPQTFEPAFALANSSGRFRGRVEADRPLNLAKDLVLMSEKGEGEGGLPPSPPATEAKASRSAAAIELLDRRLKQYETATQGENTIVTRIAGSLRQLIARLHEPTDIEQDAEFADRVSELGREIENLEEVKASADESAEKIGMLIDQSVDATAASEHGAAFKQDAEQRSTMVTTFQRVYEILRRVRESGYTPERRKALSGTIETLNNLWQKTIWTLPGVDRLRNYQNAQAQLADRRIGALLGLAARLEPGDRDSIASREKRGVPIHVSREDDLELEFLHRTLLAFSHSKAKDRHYSRSLEDLAREHQAPPSAAAAMQLYGEALHALVFKMQSPEQLLESLNQHPAASELSESLLILDSLREGIAEVGEGLETLAMEAKAADYLTSGLLVLWHSKGDGESLRDWTRSARAQGVAGFHPSIALSLFGAAYGRERIPAELLLSPGEVQEILKRIEKD